MIDKDRVRLMGPGGLQEVPEGFDLRAYISYRAKLAREREAKLKEQHGGEIPLGYYKPMWVFAGVMSLRQLKESNQKAFAELLDLLAGEGGQLSEESLQVLKENSMMLERQDDGSCIVGNLVRAIFRETKTKERFVEFVDKFMEEE